MRWFARELPETARLSLVSQYTPVGDLEKFPELKRKITAREYESVVAEAFALGLEDRLFLQERSSSGESYIPEWDY